MRRPERRQQVKQLQKYRLHHAAPQRREDAHHVLPPLGQPLQNRLTVNGPGVLHSLPKPLPDCVQQFHRRRDHGGKLCPERLPNAAHRRAKARPHRLPGCDERREKTLQVGPKICPDAAQLGEYLLPHGGKLGCIRPSLTAAAGAARRGAGGGFCRFGGGLGRLFFFGGSGGLFRCRGGQTVDLIKFGKAAGGLHALHGGCLQGCPQLVHYLPRLLPGIPHAAQRRGHLIQRRLQAAGRQPQRR